MELEDIQLAPQYALRFCKSFRKLEDIQLVDIGNCMICSDIWHKYEIVIRNFTNCKASEI